MQRHALGYVILALAQHALAQKTCSAIVPAPSAYICNAPGRSNTTDYIPTLVQTVQSAGICEDFCLDRLGYKKGPPPQVTYFQSCAAFSYAPSSQTCTLYPYRLRGNLSEHFVPDETSNIYFSDKRCFHCTRQCPDQGGNNLVDNAGFELSNTSLAPFDPYLASYGNWTVSSPGHNSPNAAYYYGYGVQTFGAPLIQYVDLCVNQVYILSFDYRAVDTKPGEPGGTSVLDYNANGFGSIGFSGERQIRTTGSGSWRTVTSSFLSKGPRYGPALRFSFYPVSPGIHALYLDNVVITPAPTTYTTTGSNLLQNGGFETGSIAPWTYDQGADNSSIITPGLTGNYALQGLLKPDGDGDVSLSFFQVFSTVPDVPYLLTFEFRVSKSLAHIDFLFEGNETLSSGNSIFNHLDYQMNETTSVQRVFTPASQNTRFTFIATVYSNSGLSEVLLDSFQVVQLAQ